MSYSPQRLDLIFDTKPTDHIGVYYVMVCDQCGQPVGKDFLATHTAFHEEIQELKDKVWRAGLE